MRQKVQPVAAPFGNLEVGQMRRGGGVARLYPAIGIRRGLMEKAGRARDRGPAQEVGQGGEIVDPDEEVDFREVFGQLRAVALHQAAGHHQALGGIALLEAGQIQDGVHRFFTGRLDEGAGIDQQEIGGRRRTGDLPARPGEAPQHDFRVHQVLGAAQGHGVDTVFGFRFRFRIQNVLTGCRWVALDPVLKSNLWTSPQM